MADPNNPSDYPNSGSGDAAGAPEALSRRNNGLTGASGNNVADAPTIVYRGYNSNQEIFIYKTRAVIDHYGPPTEFGPTPVYRVEADPRFDSLFPVAFGAQGRAQHSSVQDSDEFIGYRLPPKIGGNVSGYTSVLPGPSTNASLGNAFFGYLGGGYYVAEARLGATGFGGGDAYGGIYNAYTSSPSSVTRGYMGDAPGGGGGGAFEKQFSAQLLDSGSTCSWSASIETLPNGSYIGGGVNLSKVALAAPVARLQIHGVKETRNQFILDGSGSLPGGELRFALTVPTPGVPTFPITDYEYRIGSEVIHGGPSVAYTYTGSATSFVVQLIVHCAGATSEPAVAVGTPGPDGATAVEVTPASGIGPTRVIADARLSAPPSDTTGAEIPLVRVVFDWGDGTTSEEPVGALGHHDYPSSGDYKVTAVAYTAQDPVPPADGPTSLGLACKISGTLTVTHESHLPGGGDRALLITWPDSRQAGPLAVGRAVVQPGGRFVAKLKLDKLRPRDFHYALLDAQSAGTLDFGTPETDRTKARVKGGPEKKVIEWLVGTVSFATRKQPLTTVWSRTYQDWVCTFDPDPNVRAFADGTIVAIGQIVKDRLGFPASAFVPHPEVPSRGGQTVTRSGLPIYDITRARPDGAAFVTPNYVVAGVATDASGSVLVDYDVRQLGIPDGPVDTELDYYDPVDLLRIPIVPTSYPLPNGEVAQLYWKCFEERKYLAFDGPAITELHAVDSFSYTKMEYTASTAADLLSVSGQHGVLGSGGALRSGVPGAFLYDLQPSEINLLLPGHPVSSLDARDAASYSTGLTRVSGSSLGLNTGNEVASTGLIHEFVSNVFGGMGRTAPVTDISASRIYSVEAKGTPAVQTTVKFVCDKVVPEELVPPYVPDYNINGTGGPDYVNFARTT